MGLLKFFNGRAEASNRAKFSNFYPGRPAPVGLTQKICQKKQEKKKSLRLDSIEAIDHFHVSPCDAIAGGRQVVPKA
jgi:hypothetical protein